MMDFPMPSRERRAKALGIPLDQLPDRRNLSDEQRFFEKIAQTDGCWNWTASLNEWGYGQFWSSDLRKVELAHRTSWRLTYGTDAGELLVCHSCDNPRCVRPEHLFLGTHADNVADQVAKGRQARSPGEQNGRAKLSDAQVLSLREKYIPGKIRIVDLATEFDISFSHVWQILTQKKRKHVQYNNVTSVSA